MFSTLPKLNLNFLLKLILSSANVFILDQSKILLFGKRVKTLPNDNFLGWTKFQAFADEKLNAPKITISLLNRLKNIVGKGENVGSQLFRKHCMKMRNCSRQAIFPLPSVSYPYGEVSPIFIKFKIVVCKLCEIEDSKIC